MSARGGLVGHMRVTCHRQTRPLPSDWREEECVCLCMCVWRSWRVTTVQTRNRRPL